MSEAKKTGKCAGKQREVSSPEVRLKAAKLYLEEKLPSRLICQELGITPKILYKWSKRYREDGEAGLQGRQKAPWAPSAPGPLTKKIVELKRQEPSWGLKRISQWMRRTLFLQASPETVRQTLHQEGLMPKTKKKPPRNPPKPRFFERSTPNQLWQSDIFTFRLGGSNAYLIGFVDDYSRYVVGLGLYRSQTAENVLEVYRKAVGEYGPPKEMLTDQGRQYANWRGKTRFQMELAKDKIHHLMSRPHHPMTLGKVERFWKTIWEEFLVRGQFGSFEEAQERVRYWLQYYNHRRPHQGLDGMCPADRFFEIQKELRKVIEAGIQANVQELALNREPKEPFYMVGRMGGKSLVLQVEKGQLQMHLDDREATKETKDSLKGGNDEHDGDEGEAGAGGAQREGKGPGGAVVVDGAAAAVRDLPGDAGHAQPAQPMAGAGDGGYTPGTGAPKEQSRGAAAGLVGEAGAAVGAEKLLRSAPAPEPAPAGAGAGEGAGEGGGERSHPSLRRASDARERAGESRPATGGGHCPGAERPVDGEGGGEAPGRVAEDLLPVGASGLAGDDRGPAGEGGREAVEPARPGAGGPPATAGGAGEAATDPGAGRSHPLGDG